MTRRADALSRHPAPRSDEISTGMTAFILFTGPLAWFTQFCVGFALISWPCFPDESRRVLPIAGYGWSGGAALILLLACALLAIVSGFVAWRLLRRVADEAPGGHAHLIEAGHGRTRFVALWGTILGVGFSIATLATLAGFALVPRCAG